MIEILPESTGNIPGFKASGKLSDADCKQVLIPVLKAILAEHDQARVPMLAGEDFEGWDLKAAWDDAKFGMAHQGDLGRVAMVGPPRWVAWGPGSARIWSSANSRSSRPMSWTRPGNGSGAEARGRESWAGRRRPAR